MIRISIIPMPPPKPPPKSSPPSRPPSSRPPSIPPIMPPQPGRGCDGDTAGEDGWLGETGLEPGRAGEE